MHRILLPLLLLFAAAASAQTVPVPVGDAAASDTLRRILGMQPGQPIIPADESDLPLVSYEIRITTRDGVVLRGDYTHTPINPEAPVLLMLHDMRSNRFEFGDLPELLLRSGYSVMTMDMRGFGQSTVRTDGSPITEADEAKSDARKYYRDMVRDVDEMLDWLEKNRLVKRGGIYIVGRRVGGLMAGKAILSNATRVRGGILESPSMGILGVNLLDDLGSIQTGPILILTTDQDHTSVNTANMLKANNAVIEIRILKGIGSREILLLHPEAKDAILEFLP